MIEAFFKFANNYVLIQVEGKKVWFCNTFYGAKRSEIDGLKLNYQGVINEFPDLIDRKDWREEAIKRFKEKINEMKNEDEIVEYVIDELKNYDYKPLWKQKKGFRPEIIK